MHLVYQTKYKIVLGEPQYSDDNEGTSKGKSGSFTEQEVKNATKYLKAYYNRQMDALQEMDVEMEESEEEINLTPPSPPSPTITFEINEEAEGQPIDDDDYKDLMTVLDDLITNKPPIMKKPKPVFDLDIYKYVSFVAESNDLIWDLEYHIHEHPDDSNSTG
ncbi:uncharacterized protein LOC125076272 [Vanessa atalanta]|uniref:uncharacterized protein LOC125076272 n=1 Tax=Vanessa atalanta TaxID=42275 RepID=UPI001FCCEF4F|nr:uncharacterized protein LOC125076272 [Vanessa atalanta]XP_047544332.1 uncharacterized protein LOC125076272 [Vanessa atalanta]